MDHPGIHHISPVDGRYSSITAPLSAYFSEAALFRYRVFVEIEYFAALHRLPLPELQILPDDAIDQMRGIHQNFSTQDVLRIKDIEASTRHDIKAVEYFLKEKMKALGLDACLEFVHFGLTSQDINNTAIPLLFRDALSHVVIPLAWDLMNQLKKLANQWAGIPMLAHTHGQPASPTTLGKELMVFHERLRQQIEELQNLPVPGKFGGATGNFNAHQIAYPEVDWPAFADRLLSNLGLQRSSPTTQIDHYDKLAAMLDNIKRVATILIDLDRDCWTYISMRYFKQKSREREVGSSAMPHKVNPIDFENAEGNAGLAVALLQHLSAKLPLSRLQRDLTDSTVLRNIGVPIAHLYIAMQSTMQGLSRIEANQDQIHVDLENNLQVVAEAIQTVLRKKGIPQAYEQLKELTRNKHISREILDAFIDQLPLGPADKAELKKITPFNYTGITPRQIL